MRTPAGFECRYFYGNYFRGKNQEECRLIGTVAPPANWTADLCRQCPVPGILRANACQNLVLQGKVVSQWLGLKHKVQVKAICSKGNKPVAEPEIGCGHCHEIPEIYQDK